jgi:hypothetical protein
VPDRGNGGEVFVARVGEDCALGQKLIEPAVVFAAKPGQVVVAELIDRDGDYQLGLGRGACQRAENESAHRGA